LVHSVPIDGDHILWRLKQLFVNPKRAIVGRFKLSQKVGDLEIWYEPGGKGPVEGLRLYRD
jgi:hypothetical protein